MKTPTPYLSILITLFVILVELVYIARGYKLYYDVCHQVSLTVNITESHTLQKRDNKHIRPTIVCGYTFVSQKEDGRICVIATIGQGNQFKGSNIQFVLHESSSDKASKKTLLTLDELSGEWKKPELCTSQPILVFQMKQRDPKYSMKITGINVSFSIVDVESRSRILYFDQNYCNRNHSYLLKKSEVAIMDAKPSTTKPTRPCSLLMRKESTEIRERICVVYTNLKVGACDPNWSLVIHLPKQLNTPVTTIKCTSIRLVWCGKRKGTNYSLTVLNGELKKQFELKVRDFSGTSNQLRVLERVPKEKVDDDDPYDEDGDKENGNKDTGGNDQQNKDNKENEPFIPEHVLIIIIVIAVVTCIAGIVTFIFKKKKRRNRRSTKRQLMSKVGEMKKGSKSDESAASSVESVDSPESSESSSSD